MKERNEARPGLPPDARAEILEALCSNMEGAVLQYGDQQR